MSNFQDFAELEAQRVLGKLVQDARDGIREPLAQHIEEGGEITGAMRKYLTAYLRGEKGIKGKPGQRSQTDLEKRYVREVDNAHLYQAMIGDVRGSRERAIREVLARYPNLTDGALRKYLKKHGSTVKHFVRAIAAAKEDQGTLQD